MKHRSMHLLIKYTETLTRRGNKNNSRGRKANAPINLF